MQQFLWHHLKKVIGPILLVDYLWWGWREVYHARGFSYGDLEKTIKSLVNLGLYDSLLLKYSSEEMKKLNSYMNPDRDT